MAATPARRPRCCAVAAAAAIHLSVQLPELVTDLGLGPAADLACGLSRASRLRLWLPGHATSTPG